MHEVLLQIRARSLGLSHVEVLLHALVARLLPLVILVEEAVLCRRVVLLALVAHGVDVVRVVLGGGDL